MGVTTHGCGDGCDGYTRRRHGGFAPILFFLALDSPWRWCRCGTVRYGTCEYMDLFVRPFGVAMCVYVPLCVCVWILRTME
ncbi:hypothetical protein J3F83DRAFT_749747 [Trichoderma novae-zelandiae]